MIHRKNLCNLLETMRKSYWTNSTIRVQNVIRKGLHGIVKNEAMQPICRGPTLKEDV